jgi:hypothetical protein
MRALAQHDDLARIFIAKENNVDQQIQSWLKPEHAALLEHNTNAAVT